jgi:hypothetical protein
MEANPDCTLCVCGADTVDPEGNKTGTLSPYKTDTDAPMDDITAQRRFVATASIVAPTALAKNRAPFCDLSDVDDAVLRSGSHERRTHYFAEPCACTAKPCRFVDGNVLLHQARANACCIMKRLIARWKHLTPKADSAGTIRGLLHHTPAEFEIYRLQNDCVAYVNSLP